MNTIELMPEKTLAGFRAKHTIHQDNIGVDDIIKALETVTGFYNGFAKRKNELYANKDKTSTVEFPLLHLNILRDDKDKKDVVINLMVCYPEGTEARKKDTIYV